MSDFFPAKNYPGIFTTRQWVDAWEAAWADCGTITQQPRNTATASCRDVFYTYDQTKFNKIKITTLFPAGISTSACPSLRSEYFNLDGSSGEKFLASAARYKWDQLFIPDLMLSSADYTNLHEAATAKRMKFAVRDTSVSYAVSLKDGSFSTYLKALSSNTRLKLFNKRKKLSHIGSVRVENIWPNLDGFIDILNQFHLQRWGKLCYTGRNLVQIKSFLHRIALAEGKPNLSVIYCNDQPVSAVLDLEYLGRIYNIQSGYVEKFQDGISLGTLHFGFQLEEAFDSGADFYDFMAGNGKNGDYKKSIATHSESFVSVVIVRSLLLKNMYAVKNLFDRVAEKRNR